jgi:hypothetical protein
LRFTSTKAFESDKWAIHYYASVQGHELLTRRDLIPSQPDHKRAGEWYYKLELGELQHKIPPIISHNWRRIAFIETTGDRFEAAEEINDLFEDQSPVGRLYVSLKEEGFHPERDWPLKENDVAYTVDLALPRGNNEWLPIIFGSPDREITECVKKIQRELEK